MNSEENPRPLNEMPVLTVNNDLRLKWLPWMGDYFVGFGSHEIGTFRDGYVNNLGLATGGWLGWVQFAKVILGHPLTQKFAPMDYNPYPTFAPYLSHPWPLHDCKPQLYEIITHNERFHYSPFHTDKSEHR